MPIAWDLWFGVDGGIAATPDGAAERPAPDLPPSGWAGRAGPGVDWTHWPRSSTTGLPMMHALTLRLPEEYRRQGERYPGMSFFAGEGQFAFGEEAVAGDSAADDVFLRDLAAAVDSPGLRRFRDIIDGEFALLWLTADELDAGPTEPRADLRTSGSFADESEGHNAWDSAVPLTNIWLLERDDPNAGVAPREEFGPEMVADNGYRFPYDSQARGFHEWAERLGARSHLGGTAFPVQALPAGLSPWYLELEEFGDLNFGGGGSAQLDLETGVFDWACG
jgi:hypothetical protein